ncbi:MAG TPA: hypothetical protein VIG06_26095 [Kofleriaceae bacterium]|jgi:hypothetical protein
MLRALCLSSLVAAAGCDPDPDKLSAEECASPEVALFGVNIDPANPLAAPTAAEVHELGARWVRFAYKGEKGFAFYQARIRDYRAAGIKVLLNVSYEALRLPKPPHDATAGEWTRYGQAFVWAAGEVAGRIGSGVDAYEVWNEPDQMPSSARNPTCACDLTAGRCDGTCTCDGQCYDPFVPPEVFGPMADQAGRLLAATGAPVVLGGFSSGQPDFVSDTIASAGGLAPFRGIAIHPYGADWLPDNDLIDKLASYRFDGRAVWLTEIGVAADPARVAPYLEHVYQTILDGGYAGEVVPVVFWFAWSDGNEAGFGLLDSKGKPNATWAAYQRMAPAAHGRCAGAGLAPPTAADGCGDRVCQGSETVESCGIDCGCSAPSACGTIAPFGCYCDATCAERGDCCSDVGAACGG